MSQQYHRDNEWWVSPFNLYPEVRNTYQLPPQVSIHDATLRDGEQTPGVVMSVADKVAIAEKLAEIGVERIEAGMPAVSGHGLPGDQGDLQAGAEVEDLHLRARHATPTSTRRSSAAPRRHHRGADRVSRS